MELLSVASKEYDPDSIKIKANQLRKSQQIPPLTRMKEDILTGNLQRSLAQLSNKNNNKAFANSIDGRNQLMS